MSCGLKYSIITGDGEQMIHRNIEKSLNLRRVQIQRQNPVRPRRFQQRRHQPGRDRNPGFVLPVLPGVPIIG